MQALVEHRGELLGCAISGKIRAADVSDKQRVAGKHGSGPGRFGEVRDRDTHALDGVTGSLDEIEPALPELNGVAVFHRRVRKRRARGLSEVDARPGALRKLVMTRDEVGVQVRFDNVLDLQALLLGGVYVDIDVALRVNHGRNPFRTDEVGSMGQTTEKELLHQNRFHMPVREYTTGMSLRINEEAPNFTAETTQGAIDFHQWIGDGWAILFSHPKDFTPVCTTELGYMAGLQPEFAKRNCKVIGLSVDPVSSHGKWAADIEETQGHKVNYPMIGDPELKIAKLYDMLPADAGTTSEGRTAANNATVRTVFIVGPDKKIKLMLSYPMSTGRNFDEVLRVLDSMQLTAKHKVATPVNWKNGDDVIILPAVTEEEAKQKYPGGWKSPKPYLRIVPQPK
jgi:alkyl hydroperoxide reductase subunit AhpC